MIFRLYTWCASWQTLLKDEQGSWSSARVSWWLTLLFTLTLIIVDTATRLSVPNPAYAFLTTVVMFAGGWAAGPRMMQYIAPQIAGAAKAAGDAKVKFEAREWADGREERGVL